MAIWVRLAILGFGVLVTAAALGATGLAKAGEVDAGPTIRGSTAVRSLGEITAPEVDERYVYFVRPSKTGVQIYDSRHRRMSRGPAGDCFPGVARHGLLVLECEDVRQKIYRVHDRRLLPVRGLLRSGENIADIGRHWLELFNEDLQETSYLAWRTGARIDCYGGVECEYRERKIRLGYYVDLDSRRPRRARHVGLLRNDSVLAIDFPLFVREGPVRGGYFELLLDHARRPPLRLDSRCWQSCNPQLARPRVLWAKPERPISDVHGYDSSSHRRVRWRISGAGQRPYVSPFLTRYQALFTVTVTEQPQSTALYATEWAQTPGSRGGLTGR